MDQYFSDLVSGKGGRESIGGGESNRDVRLGNPLLFLVSDRKYCTYGNHAKTYCTGDIYGVLEATQSAIP